MSEGAPPQTPSRHAATAPSRQSDGRFPLARPAVACRRREAGPTPGGLSAESHQVARWGGPNTSGELRGLGYSPGESHRRFPRESRSAERSLAMKSAFNPFEMAQAQFDKSADILALDSATRDLLRWPLREFHFAHPGADGRRKHEGLPRIPRPAQRRARSFQGRDPLSPAGDGRHGAGPGDVDDLEVLCRGHPARRGQGRRHLRPAQSERARAGTGLPRMGPAGVAKHRRGNWTCRRPTS